MNYTLRRCSPTASVGSSYVAQRLASEDPTSTINKPSSLESKMDQDLMLLLDTEEKRVTMAVPPPQTHHQTTAVKQPQTTSSNGGQGFLPDNIHNNPPVGHFIVICRQILPTNDPHSLTGQQGASLDIFKLVFQRVQSPAMNYGGSTRSNVLYPVWREAQTLQLSCKFHARKPWTPCTA